MANSECRLERVLTHAQMRTGSGSDSEFPRELLPYIGDRTASSSDDATTVVPSCRSGWLAPSLQREEQVYGLPPALLLLSPDIGRCDISVLDLAAWSSSPNPSPSWPSCRLHNSPSLPCNLGAGAAGAAFHRVGHGVDENDVKAAAAKVAFNEAGGARRAGAGTGMALPRRGDHSSLVARLTLRSVSVERVCASDSPAGSISSTACRSCLRPSRTWPAEPAEPAVAAEAAQGESGRAPTKTVRWLDHVALQAVAEAQSAISSLHDMPSYLSHTGHIDPQRPDSFDHLPLLGQLCPPAGPGDLAPGEPAAAEPAEPLPDTGARSPSSSSPRPPSQLRQLLSPQMLRALEHLQPISDVYTFMRSESSDPAIVLVQPPYGSAADLASNGLSCHVPLDWLSGGPSYGRVPEDDCSGLIAVLDSSADGGFGGDLSAAAMDDAAARWELQQEEPQRLPVPEEEEELGAGRCASLSNAMTPVNCGGGDAIGGGDGGGNFGACCGGLGEDASTCAASACASTLRIHSSTASFGFGFGFSGSAFLSSGGGGGEGSVCGGGGGGRPQHRLSSEPGVGGGGRVSKEGGYSSPWTISGGVSLHESLGNKDAAYVPVACRASYTGVELTSATKPGGAGKALMSHDLQQHDGTGIEDDDDAIAGAAAAAGRDCGALGIPGTRVYQLLYDFRSASNTGASASAPLPLQRQHQQHSGGLQPGAWKSCQQPLGDEGGFDVAGAPLAPPGCQSRLLDRPAVSYVAATTVMKAEEDAALPPPVTCASAGPLRVQPRMAAEGEEEKGSGGGDDGHGGGGGVCDGGGGRLRRLAASFLRSAKNLAACAVARPE